MDQDHGQESESDSGHDANDYADYEDANDYEYGNANEVEDGSNEGANAREHNDGYYEGAKEHEHDAWNDKSGLDTERDSVDEKLACHGILDTYEETPDFANADPYSDAEELNSEWIYENIETQIKNMTFDTADKALKFYKEVGRHMGHDVRIASTGPNAQFIKFRNMECNRAGKRKDEKRSLKLGCPARMRISHDGRRYAVTDFKARHNHRLLSGEEKQHLNINKALPMVDKLVLQMFNECNFRTCQSLDYLQHIKGLDKTTPDYRKCGYNFMGKERKELLEVGDAQSALKFMDGMKTKDAEVEYRHFLDPEDDTLLYLLWTDGFSRNAYKRFGDILIFDGTYNTNIYGYTLVIFSGVDNHLRNIVFGGALMRFETKGAYDWLLDNFKTLMGKEPISVLTDQDAAMIAMVEKVFPGAYHRICSWHLQRNCVQHHRGDFCGFFGQLLRAHISEEEFEARWNEKVDELGIGGSKWIKDTYKLRKKWADAFFCGHFMGMMRTTQRAESVNSMFKARGKGKSTITGVITLYHQVTGQLKQSFFKAQAESEFNRPRLSKPALYGLLKSASNLYTIEVFKLFTREMERERALRIEYKHSDGTTAFYSLKKVGTEDVGRTVEINFEKQSYLCSCQKLESDGIPCCHLLTVFRDMNLTEMPEAVVLERWTTRIGKDLRIKYMHVYPLENRNMKNWSKLHHVCVAIMSNVASSDSRTTECLQVLEGVLDRYPTLDPIKRDDTPGTCDPSSTKIRDPARAAVRGAHKNESQKCSVCGIEEHKKTTCPVWKKMEAERMANEARIANEAKGTNETPSEDEDVELGTDQVKQKKTRKRKARDDVPGTSSKTKRQTAKKPQTTTKKPQTRSNTKPRTRSNTKSSKTTQQKNVRKS